LLPNYQNLCLKCTQWLRRNAGPSFRGAGGVYGPPRIYDFSFFPVNCTFETSVTATKTIHYADLDPKDHWDPQWFTEMTPLTWCHGWQQH